MASAPKLKEQMRVSPAEWAERDFFSVLEYYGFERVRQVRHGTMYRHAELASHPDQAVRMRFAHIVIPKSRSSKAYVAENVVAAVDQLEKWREERANA